MTNKKRGVFITQEGPDGSGKSTNHGFLVDLLRGHGFNVVSTREPGGTQIAEEIRAMLLCPSIEKMDAKTELLLFAAARAQHLANKIKPHLDEGFVVISDRFSDSTVAYQGHGRDLLNDVQILEEFVHRGFYPDHTLFFDIPFEECLNRLRKRTDKQDRIDQEEVNFKHRVWNGYQVQYNANPQRMVRIDALPDIENVRRQITQWVDEVFIPKYNHLRFVTTMGK